MGGYLALMNKILRMPAFAALVVALAACDTGSQSPAEVATPEPTTPAATEDAVTEDAAADAFMANIAQLCGESFAGRVVEDTPAPTGDDPFADKPLVMHVRECTDDRILIPFHVGDNRSRTWVLTRTGSGLRLKHDHRHEDGSDDTVTMYGGDTVNDGSATAGSATRQEFPVDAESIAMFTREGMEVSNSNTWAMEIEPGEVFVYELARPGGRLFRVEFDLTETVETPPAPWGHD